MMLSVKITKGDTFDQNILWPTYGGIKLIIETHPSVLY